MSAKRYLRALILFLGVACLVGACGNDDDDGGSDAPDYAADLPPVEDLAHLSLGPYVDRLAGFTDAGMVVSKAGEEVRDRGDSAIFSGIVIGSLGCDEGRPIFDAVVRNVLEHDGMIHRHPNLEAQTEADHGPSSRDAMLGVAFGFAMRFSRCPEDQPTIRDVWARHRAYVEGLGDGRLYPGAGQDKQINGGLFWLWDKLANYFGVTDAAPRASKDRYQADLIATASGTVALKQSCYPLHLNMLGMLTAVRMGSPVASFARSSWCAVTAGTDIPMAEWFCERQPARGWLDSYSPEGGYIYRHQKCKWQDTDGSEAQGPAADFMVLKGLADHTIFEGN